MSERTMRPGTARELWTELTEIFPDFIHDHTPEDLEESEREGTPSLHSVMIPFTQYFGGAQQAASQQQLRALASLVNEAVSVDDNLENAVSTCFLEHLRQVRSYKTLAPFLSSTAKDKTHA
jgi:hypothetical protein